MISETLLKKWEKELRLIDRKRDSLLKKIYAAKTGKCLDGSKKPKRKLSNFNQMLSTAANYNPKKK